ncbi:MAG: D-glycero-beta-D-manno-heptose 1,7-bisphosphate 7-phosphatase [Victivallaceae bacterium]
MNNKKRAVFLDRDGVINEEVNYLHECEKTILISGVPEALKILKQHNYQLIVVTNQAGVAKGLYPEEDVATVNNHINDLLLPFGVKIDHFYYCPHHPDFTGKCNCRKPEPGMLLQAIKDFAIDPAQSYMVGDRLSDLNAGRNAKCKKVFLVKSGYGEKTLANEDIADAAVVDNLLAAVQIIINQE